MQKYRFFIPWFNPRSEVKPCFDASRATAVPRMPVFCDLLHFRIRLRDRRDFIQESVAGRDLKNPRPYPVRYRSATNARLPHITTVVTFRLSTVILPPTEVVEINDLNHKNGATFFLLPVFIAYL